MKSINRFRRGAYQAARTAGDLEAIAGGPGAVVRRAERRFIWRLFGALMGRAIPRRRR